jgi:hypothetical protein
MQPVIAGGIVCHDRAAIIAVIFFATIIRRRHSPLPDHCNASFNLTKYSDASAQMFLKSNGTVFRGRVLSCVPFFSDEPCLVLPLKVSGVGTTHPYAKMHRGN